jgi:large subunit ribosomal protein L33
MAQATGRLPGQEGRRRGWRFWIASRGPGRQAGQFNLFRPMAQEIICLECTEARKEGKPPSRYFATRNKKLLTEKVERKKFNKFLRRHTLHKEVKF